MKKRICILLIFFLIISSCICTQVPIDDVTCFREINTELSKEFEKKLKEEYNFIKTELKLIMQFYIRENGRPDSIIIVRSNLSDYGISEEFIINKLMRRKYKCLWDVYYTEDIKPTGVTVIFNPKLCN